MIHSDTNPSIGTHVTSPSITAFATVNGVSKLHRWNGLYNVHNGPGPMLWYPIWYAISSFGVDTVTKTPGAIPFTYSTTPCLFKIPPSSFNLKISFNSLTPSVPGAVFGPCPPITSGISPV